MIQQTTSWRDPGFGPYKQQSSTPSGGGRGWRLLSQFPLAPNQPLQCARACRQISVLHFYMRSYVLSIWGVGKYIARVCVTINGKESRPFFREVKSM